jgi:glutamate carboxypeptidase
MHGGLVAGLAALRALSELGALNRSVSVLLTADEEQGSPTSQELITRYGRAASFVVVPEPAMHGGGLKTSRKGVCTYRLNAHGRAAHAGIEPTAGASAVHALIHVLDRVLELASEEPGTTVNVGVIDGGTLSNVVAEHASADVDVRVTTMWELERVISEFTRLGVTDFGADVEALQLEARPPMERTPAIAAAARSVQELARLLDLEVSEGAVGGASDANFIAPYNVAIVDGIGPEGGGAHSLDEHVSVSSLVEHCALIGLVFAEL